MVDDGKTDDQVLTNPPVMVVMLWSWGDCSIALGWRLFFPMSSILSVPRPSRWPLQRTDLFNIWNFRTTALDDDNCKHQREEGLSCRRLYCPGQLGLKFSINFCRIVIAFT